MKPTKKSWIVRVSVTREMQIITEPCTENEAKTDPYSHAIDETEVQTTDWEVKSVEPND